jgi:hypothetical protein
VSTFKIFFLSISIICIVFSEEIDLFQQKEEVVRRAVLAASPEIDPAIPMFVIGKKKYVFFRFNL